MERCKFCKIIVWGDGEFCTFTCKQLYELTIEQFEFFKEEHKVEREEEPAPG